MTEEYPIWHGQAPRIISTFLESYDFSGKTIVPFCTSHSSGIGSSAANLHSLCPDSVKWEAGKRFGAGTSKEEIEKWLEETGISIPDVNECSHVYTNQVTTEPTCTTAGETTYICTNCGESYTEKFSAIGHKLRTEVEKAGMGKNGYAAEKCTVCGKVVSENEISAVKSIRLFQVSYTYNGKNQKPSITVIDRQDKELTEGMDYTVIYPENMKNVGIYTIKIVFRGNYSGTEEQIYQIAPKNTSITKLIPGKKGFTLKWKKQKKQITGYEIAYSTSSSFPEKKTKLIRIGKRNTISKTVSKKKAGKKYYVRIRTYKTVKVQGKREKVYSDWSKTKMVDNRNKIQ